VMPVPRAFSTLMSPPPSCIVGMVRTPERETTLQWVGLVSRAEMAVYARRGERPLPDTNPPLAALRGRRVVVVRDTAMAAQLRGVDGLLDAVPGLHNLTLVADPARLPPARLESLARKAWSQSKPWREAPREHCLPVRYDGPDLPAAAARAGLSVAAFTEAHAAPRYEVACLGFLPGFPYLMGLPARLAQPRLATPRLNVPAGSVAIGGAQTGVYPQDSPGGWVLIGRTTQPLMASAREPWLLPGDALRFEPVR
ncbi:MAG: 5-oxoprolinase subunit B family protein, partial [Gemmatimonas sp.]